MKSFLLFLFVIFIVSGNTFCQSVNNSVSIEGKWLRMTQTGPVGLEFKEDGLVEVDFGNDKSTDVVSGYKVEEDVITFTDKEGAMCPAGGIYKMEVTDYYLSFDLADDMCGGRIKMTMGFWVREDFKEVLDELSDKIQEINDPELNLARARIFLATGNPQQAKDDLDAYLHKNTTDPRAYINRAGTRFPVDMKGVVSDCNKAISLEPDNKNAWFLRGLAHYELGEKQEACNDFSHAIELGFSVLKMAEEYRCRDLWDVDK
jgi:hypothetical protein